LRSLSAGKIVETIRLLVCRIEERFPGSSLAQVAGELHRISTDAVVRAERIRRPDWRLRVGIGVLIAAIAVVIAEIVSNLEVGDNVFRAEQFVQLVDSSLASLVVIGARDRVSESRSRFGSSVAGL